MRSRWGVALALLAFSGTLVAVFWLHQREAPTIGGPFTLTDAATGRAVSDRDFRGKWLLVFFGYTHCPDICPTTLGNIAAALTELGPLAKQIQPLFITLDPDRDTRQALTDYTAAFDPRIIGLSGRTDQIAAAASAYHVYYAKRVVADDYYVDHVATVYVMHPDGTYASPMLSTASATDIARQMRQLMEHGGQGTLKKQTPD